ncbi:DUF2806 domain-containing protein [Burkholderia vietnamiensis]|uniref:DUF2806 domain-containing protein n=1 Tax=Burkholderia vietnamiensis TaxID=60552 RepID=UPI001B906A9B|nr:DUF2806 domain-containing protein [Burkholderia vietnamiensis]MBR8284600.1 DUF2806 domain-containing protein [Burkholderia vietnamiensis]
MTDLLDPENDPAADDNSGVLATVFDAIGTHFGHIPAIVRKNVAKAFNHLMKVPNAYIDGKAAEIKAASDARVAVTKATGKALAQSIEVDKPLAAIATATHASRILRQQINAAQVLQYAAEEVKQEASTDVTSEPEEISEDWLNAFEREATDMSSEHMQRLFGKILAGEIKRPKSYSIRTVKLMAQLDNRAAELFRVLCSMSCTLEIGSTILDARVLDLGQPAAQNGLMKFGLGFSELNILFEYGLIISDFGSVMGYGASVIQHNTIHVPIRYANRRFGLLSKDATAVTPEQLTNFRLSGVQLSQAGKELLGIVELVENPTYTAELTKFFDNRRYALIDLAN